jgi:hypothetical protein
MPNDDILHTYSLNRGVSERTRREDKLLEDVVKRLVKYNFGSPSETLQGVGGLA